MLLTVQLSHNRIDLCLPDPSRAQHIAVAWEESVVEFMRPLWHRLLDGDSEYTARTVIATNDRLWNFILATKSIVGRVFEDVSVGILGLANRRDAPARPYSDDSGLFDLHSGVANAR